MANIEQRSVTRRGQRHNFQAQRFLYHIATDTYDRIRPISNLAQVPQYVVRRRLRRGWTPIDAVNTPYHPDQDLFLFHLERYWKFEETSGSRFATIGDITLIPSAAIGTVAGKNGLAASFNEGEYCNSSEPFTIGRPFTIALWIYIPTGASFEDFILFQAGITGTRQIVVTSEDSYLGYVNGDLGLGYADTSFVPDEWNFFTFSVSASGILQYTKNGSQLMNGVNSLIDPSPGTLQIGSLIGPGSFVRFDSLMIFRKALTQEEIDRLWNSGAGYFP